MKYMTFNSSCSYAGLANLLSFYGIDTEDREIAVQMRLPYLFDVECGSYFSGPMLQGARWFNRYLSPLGFQLAERILNKDAVCKKLLANAPAMLGLRISPENKHAVIYTGYQDGIYRFLNNKREDSPEPETLCLTEEELLARLDESVVIGILKRISSMPVDHRPYIERSVMVLQELRENIHTFCMQEQSADALRKGMNDLFRAILLDGVTMLELLGETEIAESLRAVQTQFLEVIKANRPAVLSEELDMPRLEKAMEQYQALMIKRLEME